MLIYRSGGVIYDIEIDTKSTYKEVIMGEQIVEINYTSKTWLDIRMNDYIYWNSLKYTINQVPILNKKAADVYEYRLVCESTKYILSKATFMFEDTEVDFFIAGDADFFVDMIIDNLDRYGDSSWSKGVVVATPIKNFEFKGENCWTVLNRVASELEVEIDIVDKVINIRNKIGVITGITLSYKNGLRNLRIAPSTDKNLVTRLYAFGSDRNLPTDYGYKRLRVAPVENNVALYGLWEKVMFFDEIFPQFEGSIDTVPTTLEFTDTNINFNLNDYLISGVKPKVHVLDGGLAGYTFEITNFDNSAKKVTVKQYVDENGRTFPQTGALFAVGDKYNFIDIEMPTSYITAAEALLATARDEYITKYSEVDKLKAFTVEIDDKYMRDNTISLYAGDTITIEDPIIGLSVELRIASIIQTLVRPYMYRVTLTEEIIIDKLVQLSTGQYNIEMKLRYLDQITRIIQNS